VIDILTAILWVAGSAFALLAAVGVLRMPDVFTRMQASTKASTLGVGCLLLGTALQLGDFGSVIRVLSIGGFLLLTTPVAAHVIARASYLADGRCGRGPCSTSGGPMAAVRTRRGRRCRSRNNRSGGASRRPQVCRARGVTAGAATVVRA